MFTRNKNLNYTKNNESYTSLTGLIDINENFFEDLSKSHRIHRDQTFISLR